MCDTLGSIGDGYACFGKNSDRSPNEPQVLEYRPAAETTARCVRMTYTSVPECAAGTRAVLLSRPVWMWGAEIGVNDAGVCIGNEAVFTRGGYAKTGMTGMDMLRFTLERAGSAARAVDMLIRLVETVGQGGNCGYDHDFFYDNAFLVMDRADLFVLETAGAKWAVRRRAHDSISNRLTVGREGERYAGGVRVDFAARHMEPLYSTFSAAAKRRALTLPAAARATSAADVMRALRQHAPAGGGAAGAPFARGSVASPCMHFGGLVGDHTTMSMVVELKPDGDTTVWTTGGSLPCVSLYQPWRFGTAPQAPVFDADDPAAEAYWTAHERYTRRFRGKAVPEALYAARDALERDWTAAAQTADAHGMAALTKRASEEARAFYEAWGAAALADVKTNAGFRGRWAKKDALLGKGRPE